MSDTKGKKNKREVLEAEISRVQKDIADFNSHWLNHKHIISAFAVFLMALIFAGMLIPSVELLMWKLCGGATLFFIGAMLWRTQVAKRLNSEMEAAQEAFKEYERGRRKKKK